jgi:hypothetical protein
MEPSGAGRRRKVVNRLWLARAVAASVALIVPLAACSDSQPDVAQAVVTYSRGLPDGVKPSAPTTRSPVAIWAGRREIFIVTYGSSSCPKLPTMVKAVERHEVKIETAEHLPKGDDGCTSDLAPTTITVRVPSDTDIARPLRIDIDGSITTLEPR